MSEEIKEIVDKLSNRKQETLIQGLRECQLKDIEHPFITKEEYIDKLLNYITSLQQKVEQLENMRKEAIKYIKNNKETREHYEPYGTPMGNSNYTTTHIFGYYELLEILNKGDNK